jgi:D-aminopeptidase
VAGERGNQRALAAAWLELPAVIAAGDAVAVEPAVAERNAAMRATVAQAKTRPSARRPSTSGMSSSMAGGQLAGAQRGRCAGPGVYQSS